MAVHEIFWTLDFLTFSSQLQSLQSRGCLENGCYGCCRTRRFWKRCSNSTCWSGTNDYTNTRWWNIQRQPCRESFIACFESSDRGLNLVKVRGMAVLSKSVKPLGQTAKWTICIFKNCNLSIKINKTIQGRRNLMRKGAHLRTQHLNHKERKCWFCAPKI